MLAELVLVFRRFSVDWMCDAATHPQVRHSYVLAHLLKDWGSEQRQQRSLNTRLCVCVSVQGIAHVTGGKSPGPYQPDYTQCCEHFLLHAGGYAILRGIQKGLR